LATTYKVLGQLAPEANTDVNLYTVPNSTQTVVSTIVICNRSTSIAYYRIAVRPAGATLANQHYLAFDITVAEADTTTLTLGIALSQQDVITVRASTANLTFSAFGSEITA
jgi:hypothetical protein